MSARASGLGIALVLGAVVALPIGWPLVAHPRSTLWGAPGDNFGTLAGIEAVAEWLGGGEWSLRAGDLQPLVDFPAALLTRLGGSSVLAYNLILLASFPLASGAAFLAASELGVGRLPALLSGLAFSLSPYHLAHAREHLDQAQTWPAALVAWAALAFARCPGVSRALGLVAMVAVAGLVNAYLLLVVMPLVAAGVLAGLVWGGRGRGPATATFLLVGIAGALLLRSVAAERVSLLWGSRPQLLEERAGDLWSYSARPWEYLRPSAWHPLFGMAARERFERDAHGSSPVEQTLYLGFALLALAARGLWHRVNDGEPRRRQALVLLSAGLLALWASLPPGWGGAGWLFPVLPWFRAMARFGLVVQLVVALLAAAGIEGLGRRLRAGVIAVATLEYADAASSFRVEPVELTRWLDAHAVEVADYPVRDHRHLRLWRHLAVRHRAVDSLEQAGAVDLQSHATAERLVGLGVSHIVVHGTPQRLPPATYVRSVEFAGATVYQPVVEPPPVLVLARSGFGPPERAEKRWMRHPESRVELRPASRAGPLRGRLHARLRAGGANRLRVASGGRADRMPWLALGSRPVLLEVPVELEDGAPAVVEFLAEGMDGGHRRGGAGEPLVLWEDLRFSPDSWVDEGGRIELLSGFGELEAGGGRWLAEGATLRLHPDRGVGRLRLDLRTVGSPRAVQLRRISGATATTTAVQVWTSLELEAAAETIEIDAGPALRLGSVVGGEDPRLVTIAVRRLRLLR